MTAKAGKKAVRLYKKYVKQTETINRKRKKSKKDVETLERIYRRLPKKANPERSREKELERQSETEEGFKYDLCDKFYRRLLFNNVLRDLQGLSDKYTQEEASSIKIVMDVGGDSNIVKGSDIFQNKFRGHRVWGMGSIQQFKRFLSLDDNIGEYKWVDANGKQRKTSLDWTPAGFCSYKKTVRLTIPKTGGRKGSRVLKEKVIKRYPIA